MFTTTAICLLILFTFPVIFLLWLTESQPQKIQRMYRSGDYTQQELAELFGVSRTTIRRRLAAV